MTSRKDLTVGRKGTLNGDQRVTVVPTHWRIPMDEVNVMQDGSGSVVTVFVRQLEMDDQ